MENSIDKEDLISAIIDCFNEHSKWNDEYYTECEDNPLAEYVGDLFYGEANFDHEIDLREIDAEALTLIERLRSAVGDDKTLKLMREHSYLSYSNMYLNTNEYLSSQVGEVEYQIDSVNDVAGLKKLLDAIGPLTPSEIDKIESHAGIRDLESLIGGGCIFGYQNFGCDRWVLILEVDDFIKAASDVIASAKVPTTTPQNNVIQLFG